MSWDVWGHEWAERVLKRHIESGKTRHAYLFTGAPGIGRRTLALRFIKALDCLNPPAPGEFCGECRNCRQIERMQHPDLLIGSAETEGGSFKVDTVRAIQHDLNMMPYTAPWRSALLLRFEEANASSQNALLKTLEEPPERSKLFVTASNENALLPTIGSRCEVIRLRPMPIAELREALITKKGMDPEMARRTAHISAGRAGYALRLADDPDELSRIVGIASDGLDLLESDIPSRFKYAERFKDVKRRGELRETMMIWQSLFRDMMLIASEKTAGVDLPISYVDLESELTDAAVKQTPDTWRKCISELNRLIGYLNANANLQLLTETLLLDWPRG